MPSYEEVRKRLWTGHVKALKTSRLIELLSTLPADSLVSANDVCNISILDSEGNDIGMVDFLPMEGSVDMWNEASG